MSPIAKCLLSKTVPNLKPMASTSLLSAACCPKNWLLNLSTIAYCLLWKTVTKPIAYVPQSCTAGFHCPRRCLNPSPVDYRLSPVVAMLPESMTYGPSPMARSPIARCLTSWLASSL